MRLPPEMHPAGMRLRGRILLAVLAGTLAALGQAPFDLWPLSILGLTLLFALIRNAPDPRTAGWTGWAAGTGYFALALFWIIEPFLIQPERHGWMAPFALVGMSAGLALFWAVAGAASRALGGTVLSLIAIFAAVEVARSYVLTGFPWALIGHVWIDTPVVQLAGLAGHHGLTLLALGAGASLLLLLTPSRRWWGAGGVALLGAAAIWGGMMSHGGGVSPSTDAGDTLAQAADRPVIRMIQPNIPQHLKWDRTMIPLFFQRQVDFTAALGPDTDRSRPDLVIWSETALSVLLENAEPELLAISQAAAGVPVVLGIQRFIGQRTYNSALYLDQDGVVRGIYDKHHLVPFGEYMPFGEIMARFGIHGMAASRGGGFSAGPGPRLMDLGPLGRALPLICYEAVFPNAVIDAPERPDFLMQITNDAWFGAFSGPYQHLAQARLRAVEQGLPMIRVANTGVSAMIDPLGRVTAQIPLGEAGWLDAELPAPHAPTFYARTGEVPVISGIAFLVLLSVVQSVILRRRKIGIDAGSGGA
ncbi:apolipoprotein N-acyltransferase [Seohaeicola saemankumensis]|uniref:apolipoprotein N-acyltransferase n=1 Tax=Seohaeicola saemankumensis TaxID=481181 RepID=UPI001E38766F|nr:apolipoprotein N-acyltransferase [Seohaeicola saemankumensis]MCD1627467.1 apolipoprotein N-acyltransferase [Seohaeicola saemankumensis]